MMMNSQVMQVPSCAVCLQELNQNLAVVSKCGHVYHRPCIIESVEKTSNCPLCRKALMLKNIIPLIYGISVVDCPEARDLFESMTDDEKKNVVKL